MNNLPAIYITHDDCTKLRLLASAAPGAPLFRKLTAELDRALVVPDGALPRDAVTLDSRVEYEDLGTGEIEAYQLTLPEHANIEEQRLSILAPVGTALIGVRVGGTVAWSTPGGIRHLKVRRVVQPQTAAESVATP